MTGRWFVDRLTFESCWAVRRAQGRAMDRAVVTVLDPIPAGPAGTLVRIWAHVLGLRVDQAEFFLGHLRDVAGESLYRSVRRRSAVIAWKAVTRLLEGTPDLARLNEHFGRNTVRLTLIKRVWPAVEEALRRVEVARTLSSSAPVHVVLQEPGHMPIDELVADARLQIVGWGGWRAWGYSRLAALQGIWTGRPRGPKPAHAQSAPDAVGTVLVIQEDDLGVERDERRQPHWIDAAEPLPVVVWPSAAAPAAGEETIRSLGSLGVRVLSKADIDAATHPSSPTALECLKVARAAFRRAMSVGTCESLAWTGLGRLCRRAALAAEVMNRQKVKVFLSGESYLFDASAVHLVAPGMGVRTVSYQYSNISFLSPAMMNTADVMLLFSQEYARHWEYDRVTPGRMAVLGYPYDGVVPFVAERSQGLREELLSRGATFVIAYFDESVQDGRWGVIHRSEHAADLDALAEAVLKDPTLGVVVKTQFARNSPARAGNGSALLRAATQTGRFVELCRGRHRNCVFPAEAALAADITIGHAVGGTAVLESAVTGCRSVILNPHDWRGSWDTWYDEAGLCFRSMDEILAAVQSLRSGEPSAQFLGRWDPVMAKFVGTTAACAHDRLRRLLQALLAGHSLDEALSAAELAVVARRAA